MALDGLDEELAEVGGAGAGPGRLREAIYRRVEHLGGEEAGFVGHLGAGEALMLDAHQSVS